MVKRVLIDGVVHLVTQLTGSGSFWLWCNSVIPYDVSVGHGAILQSDSEAISCLKCRLMAIERAMGGEV
jgi:hypothetical protein